MIDKIYYLILNRFNQIFVIFNFHLSSKAKDKLREMKTKSNKANKMIEIFDK